jgi:hypothetical protein
MARKLDIADEGKLTSLVGSSSSMCLPVAVKLGPSAAKPTKKRKGSSSNMTETQDHIKDTSTTPFMIKTEEAKLGYSLGQDIKIKREKL